MPLEIQRIPEELIALQRELQYHPELLAILEQLPSDQGAFEERFAHIAAYCNVALDGYYTQQQICGVADFLIRQLQAKRSVILLPH